MDSTKVPIIINRDDLARRLGVSGTRLVFRILQNAGRIVAFEVLVDGKDLTPEQERIAIKFLEEQDGLSSVRVPPQA